MIVKRYLTINHFHLQMALSRGMCVSVCLHHCLIIWIETLVLNERLPLISKLFTMWIFFNKSPTKHPLLSLC